MVIQQRSKIRAPTSRSGCVNHTIVEDIPEGEEVHVGTFLLFGHHVTILFDSRASHDFMRATCAKRAKLALTVAKPSYMISTLGGRVVAKRIAREVLLELARQVFPTHLILLGGQGIDVILSWMKLHKAILVIVRRLVYLDFLIYRKVTLHLPVVVLLKASIHHTVAKNIEEIPVVRAFPDVFPDDLPGMSPERDIEFKIELQPGWYCSHGQESIQNVMGRVARIEDLAEGPTRQRLHWTKFITLGLSSLVCAEKR
jgi:hypothetical protein